MTRSGSQSNLPAPVLLGEAAVNTSRGTSPSCVMVQPSLFEGDIDDATNQIGQALSLAFQQVDLLKAVQHEQAEDKMHFAAVGRLATRVRELQSRLAAMTQETAAELEKERTRREAAEAQLAKVSQLHESTARNVAKKVVSPNELSLSQKDVDVRAAELDRKRAELDEVELRARQAARRSHEASTFAEEGKKLLSTLEPPTPDAKP